MADFIDLAALKDDLGITGSANDAWLNRRVAGLLARMSEYTHRYIGPKATFVDTWRPEDFEVNAVSYWPSGRDAVFYLRHFPVDSVTETQDDGSVVSGLILDKASGKLVGYGNAASPSRFNSPTVTYVAGWETLPLDLYEVLLGALTSMWTARANAQAGITGAASIDIQDVGSIDLSGPGGTSFERAASTKVVDPILGPYAAILDSYTDRRATLGSVMMPRTTGPTVVTP